MPAILVLASPKNMFSLYSIFFYIQGWPQIPNLQWETIFKCYLNFPHFNFVKGFRLAVGCQCDGIGLPLIIYVMLPSVVSGFHVSHLYCVWTFWISFTFFILLLFPECFFLKKFYSSFIFKKFRCTVYSCFPASPLIFFLLINNVATLYIVVMMYIEANQLFFFNFSSYFVSYKLVWTSESVNLIC